MRTTFLALGLVLAAAAIAVGSAAASPQLTKHQYIGKADAICSSASAQVRKLGRASSRAKVASIGDKWLAIDRRALAAVRRLAPPASDRATIANAIHLADIAINKGIAGVIEAAKSGNGASYNANVRRASALINKAHEAARTYGFSDCARW